MSEEVQQKAKLSDRVAGFFKNWFYLFVLIIIGLSFYWAISTMLSQNVSKDYAWHEMDCYQSEMKDINSHLASLNTAIKSEQQCITWANSCKIVNDDYNAGLRTIVCPLGGV